ncbi:putative rNA polymerase I termination factor [Clavispora lusitaniae]|uniref:RNA polymerase I termination factor n=1 Tax=Clavispora lusitaniae TaxID=36911 RepID=A0AA91Q2K5_CLALS|nr:putative rNA polymerase I termination factor [Clavispora lusitaniae]
MEHQAEMGAQPEIGGAQALLQLGTSKEDEEKALREQQLNDAVEAAVMQYVGGMEQEKRSGDKDKNDKAGAHHDNSNDHDNDNSNSSNVNDDKAHEAGNDSGSNNGHNIDNSNNGNDNSNTDSGNNNINNDNNNNDNINNNGNNRTNGNNGTNGGNGNNGNNDNGNGTNINDSDNINNIMHLHDINNINNMNNMNNIHDSNVMHDGELPIDIDYPWDRFLHDKGIDPELASLDTEHDQLVHAAILGAGELAKQLAPAKRPKRPVARAKYDCTTLDGLVAQAASEACAWYNAQADAGADGPRLFSPEEIAIVESFVDGYCRLHNLSRADICRRVWASERTKDSFWESVTKVLPYRSRASVYKHIRRQYHVFEVRARWTPAEDELLRKVAGACKTNWKKVGEALGRMPEDCRDRWRNYVKCGSNRAANKWSPEEERTLRTIVTDMLAHKETPINWTVVSERMNGVRSRIQCRYKWNKLVRRESLARVSSMDARTKAWLVGRMAASRWPDADAVDWEYLSHACREEQKAAWSGADLRTAFEHMRASVRDGKTLPLAAVLSKLAASMYEPERTEPAGPTAEAAASSVATATVAAVAGVSAHEAEHQEYSLWR